MCLAVVAPAGCKGYRIEYIKRPAYYRDAQAGGAPERVTLEDGTVLVFTTRDAAQANALTCLRNQEYQLMWDQLVERQGTEAALRLALVDAAFTGAHGRASWTLLGSPPWGLSGTSFRRSLLPFPPCPGGPSTSTPTR
jgi:hypothetical protein